MDDLDTGTGDRPLSVRLSVHLDRRPISGCVRTDHGDEERFVGWLGFVDALRRLHSAHTAQGGTSHGESRRRAQ